MDEKKPISVLDLYRATPRTNCRECGLPTCMAFATSVVVEKKKLDRCPHLGPEALSELGTQIAAQQEEGVYVKRNQYKITEAFLREKLEDTDLAAVAGGLGAQTCEKDGETCLRFLYLNRDCVLSKQKVEIEGTVTGDHWDNILLYNYVASSGTTPVSGQWIPIDNIPGNIPKKPELEHGCENKIAVHFSGSANRLAAACNRIGGTPVQDQEHVDAVFSFLPLPRIPFLLLFWDEDREEGFSARAKVLFDRTVTEYLDIESLVFLAEKFAEALIAADG